MKTYIAEIAGKDSIAAVVRFMTEMAGGKNAAAQTGQAGQAGGEDIRIIPTIVYTNTEYGDRASYYNSIAYLRRKAKALGICMEETVELENGRLWNLLCARFQQQIHQRYGFYTPCIACHLFTHLLRLPLLAETGAAGIITGERHSHQGRLKANQHPLTIECFNEIFAKNGVQMIRPLVEISDTAKVDSYIDDVDVIAHANDLACVFSGNLRGFDLADGDNRERLSLYLAEFLQPAGELCAREFLRGGAGGESGSAGSKEGEAGGDFSRRRQERLQEQLEKQLEEQLQERLEAVFRKDLDREQLMELIEIYSKNWLAMDGLWFQALEARHGMDETMEADIEVWEKFTVIEARKIKKFLGLAEKPGLEGLASALALRLYANVNRDEIIIEGNTLTYRMLECRVQHARSSKGMEFHPCRAVGIVEYGGFAKAIDERIECECLSCFPQVTDESCHCAWRFTLVEEQDK